MKTNAFLNNDTQKLEESLALFLKEFKPLFEDFFTSLCTKFDPTIEAYSAKEMATALTQSLLNTQDAPLLYEKLFLALRQDHPSIDFVIQKSMVYLLEHSVIFAQTHSLPLNVELLCERLYQMIDSLALHANALSLQSDAVIDYTDVMGKMPSKAFQSDLSNDVLLSPRYEMMNIFQQMLVENQKNIYCLSLYEGIPISSEATVVEILDANVTFQMSPLQEIAMLLENQAFLVKNSYFPNHLKADIVHIDFKTNHVILTNFRYVQSMPALQREGVRVYPSKTSNIALYQSDALYLNGILHDISTQGLSILSNEKEGLHAGEDVLLEFELQDEKVSINGKVVNIISYTNSFRYCIHILPNEGISQMIANYIEQREKEIIAKLQMELQKYA